MLFRDLAVSIHLVGVVLWIGGIVAAAIVAATAAKEAEGGRNAMAAARRAVLFAATPGMLLAWIAGLAFLVPNFADLYARAGWMHTKLTLLLILTGITGVLTGRLRKAAAGTKPASSGLFAGLGLAVLLAGAVIVFLAELQPGR